MDQQQTIAVHVGPRNGRLQRLVVFQHNGREYRDNLDTDSGFARQKSIERAATRFGVDPAEVANLDAAIVKAADAEDARPSDDTTTQFPMVSCAALATSDYSIRFLARDILAEGVPCMIGGQLKTLKTLLAIALAVSLATGKEFLNRFPVLEACRVCYFTGEGGLAVVKDYALRVAASFGIGLADITALHFCDRVPQLASIPETDAMTAALIETEAAVGIFDPLYMAMSGKDSGNIMAQGPIFRSFNRQCAEIGVTPIIVHHIRKNRQTADAYDVPELSELAWSGPAEFAGQWLLVGRAEAYDADNPGEHTLHLVAGGRAGHSSRHVLAIQEGRLSDPGGRRWEVEVMAPGDADQGAKDRKEAAKEAERAKQLEEDRAKLLAILVKFPEGETERTLHGGSGLYGQRFRLAMAELVRLGEVVPCEVVRRNRKTPYEGWKLAGEDATHG